MTRVLTTTTPTKLIFVAPPDGCWVYIYGSILNQPVTVSVSSDGSSIPLELGPGTGNIGARLYIHPNSALKVEYHKKCIPIVDEYLRASLKTQLRIALVLFWTETSIAISLCAHVAGLTKDPPLYPMLNAQAVALGQQLAAQTITRPDLRYAPSLKMEWYRRTAEDTLEALRAFE